MREYQTLKALMVVGTLRQYLDGIKPHEARTRAWTRGSKLRTIRATQPRVRVNLIAAQPSAAAPKTTSVSSPQRSQVEILAELNRMFGLKAGGREVLHASARIRRGLGPRPGAPACACGHGLGLDALGRVPARARGSRRSPRARAPRPGAAEKETARPGRLGPVGPCRGRGHRNIARNRSPLTLL